MVPLWSRNVHSHPYHHVHSHFTLGNCQKMGKTTLKIDFRNNITNVDKIVMDIRPQVLLKNWKYGNEQAIGRNKEDASCFHNFWFIPFSLIWMKKYTKKHIQNSAIIQPIPGHDHIPSMPARLSKFQGPPPTTMKVQWKWLEKCFGQQRIQLLAALAVTKVRECLLLVHRKNLTYLSKNLLSNFPHVVQDQIAHPFTNEAVERIWDCASSSSVVFCNCSPMVHFLGNMVCGWNEVFVCIHKSSPFCWVRRAACHEIIFLWLHFFLHFSCKNLSTIHLCREKDQCLCNFFLEINLCEHFSKICIPVFNFFAQFFDWAADHSISKFCGQKTTRVRKINHISEPNFQKLSNWTQHKTRSVKSSQPGLCAVWTSNDVASKNVDVHHKTPCDNLTTVSWQPQSKIETNLFSNTTLALAQQQKTWDFAKYYGFLWRQKANQKWQGIRHTLLGSSNFKAKASNPLEQKRKAEISGECGRWTCPLQYQFIFDRKQCFLSKFGNICLIDFNRKDRGPGNLDPDLDFKWIYPSIVTWNQKKRFLQKYRSRSGIPSWKFVKGKKIFF